MTRWHFLDESTPQELLYYSSHVYRDSITFCEGMATTVTAAHHSIWRHLYDSMHAAQKPMSKLKFVTLDKESNMSTLWQREEFQKICSKEDLTEKAQEIEVTIPVKKSQEARHNHDPQSFFANRF